MVLGLVGKAGSGKSTVADELERCGAKRISLDKLGHCVLAQSSKELIDIFGQISSESGEIDRGKLGNLVFSDRSALQKLNALIHPLIRSKALQEIDIDYPFSVIDGALLHEIGLSDYCDRIIWLDCPDEEAVRRLVARGMKREKAIAILRSQSHLETLKDSCDAVISTTGSTEATFMKVRSVLFEWGIMV
jgi:dephospho-CoA kinase